MCVCVCQRLATRFKSLVDNKPAEIRCKNRTYIYIYNQTIVRLMVGPRVAIRKRLNNGEE